MIDLGFRNLDLSLTGENLSAFHLQAGIAAVHSAARDFASTDWKAILELYDVYTGIDRSPIVSLNRAVVFGRVYGPAEALKLLHKLVADKTLGRYYLTHAVYGELYFKLGDFSKAERHFRASLNLARLAPERRFLDRNLVRCQKLNNKALAGL